MKIIVKTTILSLLLGIGFIESGAQVSSQDDRETNFGFSRNPPSSAGNDLGISLGSSRIDQSSRTGEGTALENGANAAVAKKFESVETAGSNTPGKRSTELVLDPTEIYKVGIGDVLFISLQNSRSSNFMVLGDGSIDYPLAGGSVIVSGKTVEEIETVLRNRIKLFEDPAVEVKVKKHASHAIEIGGMAVRTGTQFLQREAMPLFVVRAMAIAESGVTLILIKRSDGNEIVARLGTGEYDNTLVLPGDSIEFTTAERLGAKNGFLYLEGAVRNAGRYTYFKGTTLTQAIVTAGGPSKGKAKKAVISRKNEAGLVQTASYKLKDIRRNKIADPRLMPGDIVEVRR